jgi:aspartyl-tRNA(Asn)/glutamyl-tRNA(Gln) amidotransferase subunit A
MSIIPAPLFNEQTVSIGSKTILQTREALLRNTIVFNSTGLTAVSIPIGFTRNGLPIGGQIIGPPFKENLILSVAYSFERNIRRSINLHQRFAITKNITK